eukprot:4553592-Pyramimonas_sp.AAC.1
MRSRRPLGLKNAGAFVDNVQRAGPRAAGLGSAAAGLSPKQLHAMRPAAARSLSKDKSGALMSFRLRPHPIGARIDPLYYTMIAWCYNGVGLSGMDLL